MIQPTRLTQVLFIILSEYGLSMMAIKQLAAVVDGGSSCQALIISIKKKNYHVAVLRVLSSEMYVAILCPITAPRSRTSEQVFFFFFMDYNISENAR